LTQGRSADDGAHAAQRRADTSGANTERRRQWLRDLTPDDSAGGDAERGWTAASSAADGTAQARDQAARMHDNAASMHDEAVRLGIGDSEEHRRSAARHREAATSHRPPPDEDS
jgi:hypothetical protein